jgi:glycosyltransferase involved in cell wall biosynthesis
MDVVVYCRASYYKERPSEYRGARLVYLPAPRAKGLESLLHSFLSTVHVLAQGADVVYFLDPANAPFVVLLRLCGKKVVVHTDGLGWKRKKWGRAARAYYRAVEGVSARVATALVTDNEVMQEYYKTQHRRESRLISYGAESSAECDDSVLTDMSVKPGGYLLVVARLEPDNNTDLLIREYVRSNVSRPLLIVGDAPYSGKYLRELRALGNDGVRFVGRVNEQNRLNALYRGAYAYLHGHEVGGTNPSLLRAMAAGVAPIVLDSPFNMCVIQDCGFSFGRESGTLAALLRQLTEEPSAVRAAGVRARARARSAYTWESVVGAHHALFQELSDTRI